MVCRTTRKFSFLEFPRSKENAFGREVFISENKSFWKVSDPKLLVFGKDLNLEK
jgi:hypothetical protein